MRSLPLQIYGESGLTVPTAYHVSARSPVPSAHYARTRGPVGTVRLLFVRENLLMAVLRRPFWSTRSSICTLATHDGPGRRVKQNGDAGIQQSAYAAAMLEEHYLGFSIILATPSRQALTSAARLPTLLALLLPLPPTLPLELRKYVIAAKISRTILNKSGRVDHQRRVMFRNSDLKQFVFKKFVEETLVTKKALVFNSSLGTPSGKPPIKRHTSSNPARHPCRV